MAAALVAAFSSSAFARDIELSWECRLIYRDSVNAKGPCTARQTGDIVSVKGTVEENGPKYTAIIDNRKNEGLLLGAGTFTPANGRLEENGSTLVRWPNGYLLKFFDMRWKTICLSSRAARRTLLRAARNRRLVDALETG